MSSSLSSPEREIVSVKTKKGKKSRIALPPEKSSRDDHIEHEDVYKPPEGYALLKPNNEETEFDWDDINNNENLELWVVRMPEGLKPRHLESVKIEIPSSSNTTRLGAIDRKNTAYDVWALGDDEADAVGGDELRAVSCLLPRKNQSGKLYQAPHPIARRLVISTRPSLPTPPASSPESSPIVHQNPPRPRYPSERLKHRFAPLGSLAPLDDTARMDIELSSTSQSQHKQEISSQGTVAVGESKKKRRGDAASPKKTKRAKKAS